MLSPVSYLAIAVIVAAIAAAWTRRFLASGALAIANLVVFVMTAFGPHVTVQGRGGLYLSPVIHQELGLRASNVYAGSPMAGLQAFTSMFVHADFFHILGNLIVLLAFALPFEERIGHRRFLLLYFSAGLVGAGAQMGYYWGEPMLMMGASGAVFGVIGAFAAMYPRLVIPLPLPLMFIMIFVRMRVLVAAMVFGGMQILFMLTLSQVSNTAFMAHIGGLAGGLVIAGIYVRIRGVPEQQSKTVTVGVQDLERFAPDARTRAALKHMEDSRDEPAIFQAWWERFWAGARDPDTGQRVRPSGPGKVTREDGTVIAVGTTEPTKQG